MVSDSSCSLTHLEILIHTMRKQDSVGVWHCDTVTLWHWCCGGRHSRHTDHWWGREVRGHWGTLGDTLGPGQTRRHHCLHTNIPPPTPPRTHINIYASTYLYISYAQTYTSTYTSTSHMDIYSQHWTKETILNPDVFIVFDVWCFNGSCLNVTLQFNFHCVIVVRIALSI